MVNFKSNVSERVMLRPEFEKSGQGSESKKSSNEREVSIFSASRNSRTEAVKKPDFVQQEQVITPIKPKTVKKSSGKTHTRNLENKKPRIVDENNSFASLKTYMNEGHSAEETYNHLVNSIKSNKNNPEYVQKVVDNLLHNISYMYDTDISYKPVAETKEKALETFLKNTNYDDVDGAICSTMHGLMKDVLNDAGIPAVLLASKMYTDNKKDNFGGHATLLYKMGENKYVHSNYGETTVVEADNIKSAVKQLFKQSDELTGERGYIMLSGNDGESYKEFIYQDEAVYGKDIEKSNHVKENAFLGDNVKNRSTLDFNVNYNDKSKTNNVEAQGTIAIPNKNLSIDVGVAYKTNGETDTMLNSRSVGAKFDLNYKKDFGKNNNQSIKLNADGTYANIKGETENNTYETNMLKGSFDFGYENTFFDNGTTSLTGGLKTSIIGSGSLNTVTSMGDVRISGEAGLAMQNKFGSIGSLNTELSAGVIGDLNKLNYTYQAMGLNPGLKANIKTALTLHPSDKVYSTIDTEGYYLKTNTVEQFGLSSGVFGSYKATNNVDIYGGVNVDVNKKNLEIAKFKETIDNDVILNATVGAKFADSATIGFNFAEDIKTKDFFAGVSIKKQF